MSCKEPCCVACCEEAYEEMLTDSYGTVKFGILEFDSGRIIRELDETAFRCGMADENCQCEQGEKE